VVSDLPRSEIFYRDGLGFRAIARGPVDDASMRMPGLDDTGAAQVVMQLGAERIALVQFPSKGRPYPPGSRSDDLWFQHIAIVVGDMDSAYARLSRCSGWCPISADGPQLLPLSDGGVKAFKFRDPDGHPLELIWFPPGQGRAIWHEAASSGPFLGIDHSALCIASIRRSLGFYRALGFTVSNRSLNHGPAQTRLDGLPDAKVRVTALRPASETGPGLELLSYQPQGRPMPDTAFNDLITDWVTLAISPSSGCLPYAVRDPDGHRLILADQGADGLPA
jgi:catechol 2,3-dioxygenase-like lactoylglutathione lyase family enzyme